MLPIFLNGEMPFLLSFIDLHSFKFLSEVVHLKSFSAVKVS